MLQHVTFGFLFQARVHSQCGDVVTRLIVRPVVIKVNNVTRPRHTCEGAVPRLTVSTHGALFPSLKATRWKKRGRQQRNVSVVTFY